jgi:uncharacterized phage-like protein YoqJ
MTVTFCGHRQIDEIQKVRAWLCVVTEHLIEEGAETFYLGGYGAFDEMAAAVLGEYKQVYPQIQRLLVLAYLDRGKTGAKYDNTVYPPLEGVPQRLAIVRRNRWMVEAADVVVACVDHDWGGAAATLRHARQKKKRVLVYPSYQ